MLERHTKYQSQHSLSIWDRVPSGNGLSSVNKTLFLKLIKLDSFLIECSKTETKLIILTNQTDNPFNQSKLKGKGGKVPVAGANGGKLCVCES